MCCCTEEAMKVLCCSGDYYKYDDTIARVKSSGLSQSDISLMIQIIDTMEYEAEDLNQTKSRLIREGCSSSKIDTAIWNFEEMNVNPVFIPDEWDDYKEIPNLQKLL